MTLFDTVCMIFVGLLFLGYLAFRIWVTTWLISDAEKRGYSSGKLIAFFWIFGSVAAVIWVLIRPQPLFDKPFGEYVSSDDVLVAASRLDSQGNWDKAIEFYQQVAVKWPENSSYAQSCIDSIKEKQALAV